MTIRRLLVPLLCATAAAGSAGELRVEPDADAASLARMAASLRPGDTLVFAEGRYAGPVVIQVSGTGVAPMTVRGEGTVVIAGGGGRPRGAVVTLRGDGIQLRNVHIEAGGDTSLWRGLYVVGDRIEIRKVTVEGVRANGIQISDAAGSVTLRQVEVRRCGGGALGHQVYAGSDFLRHPGAVFRMEQCVVEDGRGGNNVKSRAWRTEIVDCTIAGAAFHELDLVGPDLEAQPRAPSGVQSVRVWNSRIVKRAGSRGVLARVGADGLVASMGTYEFRDNQWRIEAAEPRRPVVVAIHRALKRLEFRGNAVDTADGRPVTLFQNRWSVRSGEFVVRDNRIPGTP